MTTKTAKKSKGTTKQTKSVVDDDHAEFDPRDHMTWSTPKTIPSTLDRRKELLATVAGSVAAGLVTAPTEAIASPEGMATAALDIAEEILKQAGIPSVSSSS